MAYFISETTKTRKENRRLLSCARQVNRNYQIFLRKIYFYVLAKNSLPLAASTKKNMRTVNRLPAYRRERGNRTAMVSLIDIDRLLSNIKRIIYHFNTTLKLLNIKNFPIHYFFKHMKIDIFIQSEPFHISVLYIICYRRIAAE